MSIENLRRLAERAEGIEGRQVERLDEVHGRITIARRRRAAGAATTAAVVVTALVAGGALLTRSTGTSDDNTPPINTPTSTPTIAIPTGQTTVEAEIGPGDIRGWELRGSRTNTDAGFAGATDLDLVVETGELFAGQSHVMPFCQGDASTWWVLTFDLDGVNGFQATDGSLPDGSRGMYGQCSPDVAPSVPASTEVIDMRRYNAQPMAYPVRMFVTQEIPEAARPCISGGVDSVGCITRHGLLPLDSTEATFGFGVYEHRGGPRVLKAIGWSFEALALIEGVEFLVDRAVVAAPGGDRLVVPLPASDHARIVGLVSVETEAMQQCADTIDIEVVDADSERAHQEAVQDLCVNELELRVDGDRPRLRYDWSLAAQNTFLPAGESRVITVDITRNDPRNITYALVIWEARS